MDKPLIYYGFTPHRRRWERQPSEQAIVILENQGYEVYRQPCLNAPDYAAGLRECWTHPGPLVIIEHDMAPTLAQFEELVGCPEPLCARTYWIALGTAGHYPMMSACEGPLGTIRPDGTVNPRVDVNRSRAGYSAIGCCKLALSVRERMTIPPLCDWRDVEFHVNKATAIIGDWHLHWPPISHHHGFMEDRYGVYGKPASRPVATGR